FQQLASGIGDGVYALIVDHFAGDAALFLQQLQCRVDCARAWTVEAAGALLDCFNQFVTVMRFVFEQFEQHKLDVTASLTKPSVTASTRWTCPKIIPKWKLSTGKAEPFALHEPETWVEHFFISFNDISRYVYNSAITIYRQLFLGISDRFLREGGSDVRI